MAKVSPISLAKLGSDSDTTCACRPLAPANPQHATSQAAQPLRSPRLDVPHIYGIDVVLLFIMLMLALMVASWMTRVLGTAADEEEDAEEDAVEWCMLQRVEYDVSKEEASVTPAAASRNNDEDQNRERVMDQWNESCMTLGSTHDGVVVVVGVRSQRSRLSSNDLAMVSVITPRDFGPGVGQDTEKGAMPNEAGSEAESRAPLMMRRGDWDDGDSGSTLVAEGV